MVFKIDFFFSRAGAGFIEQKVGSSSLIKGILQLRKEPELVDTYLGHEFGSNKHEVCPHLPLYSCNHKGIK